MSDGSSLLRTWHGGRGGWACTRCGARDFEEAWPPERREAHERGEGECLELRGRSGRRDEQRASTLRKLAVDRERAAAEQRARDEPRLREARLASWRESKRRLRRRVFQAARLRQPRVRVAVCPEPGRPALLPALLPRPRELHAPSPGAARRLSRRRCYEP